ncbi:MAG: tRNA (guanine-N7)-methyltransferase [Deltaproteobacteria bacterium]|nr:tRNA (guanine-N7)-methyltransferase [Deltaproteobacteria bacterium]
MVDQASVLPADCWQRLFGNTNPVALEIGPGKGEFLRAAARARPEWNFYAIEISFTRTRSIEAALRAERLTNARVLWGDAGCVLTALPGGSVAAAFVQFPDPWWKRRHFKRRLWTPAVAAGLRHVLAPGAEVEFLTDVEDTFRLGRKCLDGEPELTAVSVGRLQQHDTDFARKAVRGGRPIYRAVYKRRGGE